MLLRLRNWPAARVPDTTTLTVFDTDTERYHVRLVADEELARARFDLADHIYQRLERDIAHEQLPTCVAPDCVEKGTEVLIALEEGRLAGRNWVRGDEIRLCGRHGFDVRRARAARSTRELPDWLRADVHPDELEVFDAEADPFWRGEYVRRSVLAVGRRGD